jgi:hypothetical protein
MRQGLNLLAADVSVCLPGVQSQEPTPQVSTLTPSETPWCA